jgi:hypothetical protein
MDEREQRGQSVRKWCAENGLNEKTYYYRLKRIREEALEEAESRNGLTMAEQPVFATVSLPRGSVAAVTVQIGAYFAEIQNGADGETVERVLQVLSRL